MQTTSAALRYEPSMGVVRRHPAVLAAELVVTAPFAGLALFLIATVWRGVAPGVPAALPAALAIALWLYVAWIRWASASLTLTDQRVVLAKGVLSQTQLTIPFGRIQYVGLQQSIPGRLLGYGTLEFGVSGYSSPHRFPHAPVGALRDRMLISV